MATPNSTGVQTIFENPTANSLTYPFLGRHGVTLAPGQQIALDGGPFDTFRIGSDQDRESLKSALKNGLLLIVATPAAIVEDPVSGISSAVGVTSAALALTTPSWAPPASYAAYLSTSTPANHAKSVAAATTIVADFNEAVTGTTITLTTGGNTVSGSTAASNGNKTYTFTPGAALTGGGSYVVTVSGATNGNSAVTPTMTSTFSVAPVVNSVTPANSATSVALTSTVVVVFNEPVTGVVFSLLKTATPVAGTLAITNNNKTFTFTPSANLIVASTYNVSVTGGTDAGGNVMATFTSTFAT